MTYILYKSKPIYNNTVTINYSERAYTTKKRSIGKWYYEFTHISGTNYHLAGFAFGSSTIYVYPQGNPRLLKIYFTSLSIEEGLKEYNTINFTDVVENHTVGLSFDSFQRIFTVNYNNQIRQFHVKSNEKATKITPILKEASDSEVRNFVDTLSANFGEKNFTYSVPLGYLPWNKIIDTYTYKGQLRIRMIYFILFILAS